MGQEKGIKISIRIVKGVLGSKRIHCYEILAIIPIFLLVVLNVFGDVKERAGLELRYRITWLGARV
jgi:t-SNARE complex subunit (syntaxin)